MVWVKYSLGGLGAALIGMTALLVIGVAGPGPDAIVPLDMRAPGLVALCFGLLAVVWFAPRLTGRIGGRSSMESAAGEPQAGVQVQNQALPASQVHDGLSGAAAVVRLMPMLPLGQDTQADSWIGGCPSLPADMEWPSIDDQPASFLAQIDCSQLPSGLWGGSGPRQGALTFFRAARTEAGTWPVQVHHVQGQLARRSPPQTHMSHPCWPLRVAAQKNAASQLPEYQQIANPDWARLHDVDLTDPAYQPFDWQSAAILLNRMTSLIEQCTSQPDPEAADHSQHAQTTHRLADLTKAFTAARSELAFSDDVQDLLMNGLTALTLPDSPDETGKSKSKTLPLTRHGCVTSAYFAPFEKYCRQVYAMDPARLPAAQRALFEPLWAHNARHETGCMGAESPEAADTGDEVLLLDLPSSELLGCMFGDGRSFRVFAPAKAFARGDLSAVRAAVVR